MNKKLLIGALIVVISLIGSRSWLTRDSSVLKKNRAYIAINKPAFKYGRIFVTSKEISWGNGFKNQYKVLKETKDYCIVEFVSKPLPEFWGKNCRYAQFTVNEPEKSLYAIGMEVSKELDFDNENKDNDCLNYALIQEAWAKNLGQAKAVFKENGE